MLFVFTPMNATAGDRFTRELQTDRKPFGVIWIAENKVKVVVVWKQMDWILCYMKAQILELFLTCLLWSDL